MRSAFEYVAANFQTAKTESYGAHPLAAFLRKDAAAAVTEALGPVAKHMKVKGSPGSGGWAAVPWVAVLDPIVTTSPTWGHYIVYLFSADMTRLYLSLNQGTTAAHKEFKSRAKAELQRRASILRDRVPEYRNRFSAEPIDLAATGPLPSGYEAGHAFGKTYSLNDLPIDGSHAEDLHDLVELYLKATARGGTGFISDLGSSETDYKGVTIVEQRRYRFHRRIERNAKASQEARKVHGYVCQACGFDFEKQYGSLGHLYIEAHHLTPLADLPEGEPVPQDPEKDFAVLCANCHRMIHRKNATRTIAEFRELVRTNCAN